MIPCDSKNIKKDFNILMSELKEYNSELLDKDYAIAITKCDLLDNDLIEEYRIEMKNNFEKIPYFLISSVSKYGINRLKDGLWNLLN
jgi:GTP-binding protein